MSQILRVAHVLALGTFAEGITVNGKQWDSLSFKAELQPQVVAQTLVSVEQEWRKQATAFVSCDGKTPGSDCSPPSLAFQHSCGTVVKAMLTASSGDRSALQEYLSDVCGQSELSGWKQGECQMLSSSVLSAMSVDAYENREDMHVSRSCDKFWYQFVADERSRMKAENAKIAADHAVEKEHMEKVQQEETLREARKKARMEEAKKRDAAKQDEEEKKVKAAEKKARVLSKTASKRHKQALRKEDEVQKAIAEANKAVQEAKQVPQYTVGVSNQAWTEPWASNATIALAAHPQDHDERAHAANNTKVAKRLNAVNATAHA